jgi:hypothetical protein
MTFWRCPVTSEMMPITAFGRTAINAVIKLIAAVRLIVLPTPSIRILSDAMSAAIQGKENTSFL